MAGRGRGAWVAAVCAALLGLSGGLVGCDRAAPGGAQVGVQRVLDRRADAVLHHDASAFRATGTDAGFRALADVPLTSWTYRITGFHRSGARATVEADLRYRVTGYDRTPVSALRELDLRQRDGRWYVAGDRPAPGAPQQLWEQGPVTVVKGAHSLVLGVGQQRRRLGDFARLADHAVPAVRDAWGGDWSGHVVVLVPKSLEGMAGLLGAAPSAYRGIAAVTTGEAGSGTRAPADRVVVNPDAYAVLGDLGKQVVLTHETTHVATRDLTTRATPLWLSEGYADWVGYRGTGRRPTQAAPELARAVTAGQVPADLPADRDFGFGGDATRLAQAYEGGWLACRMIADNWGEAKLNAFYRTVGAHGKRPGAVEAALRDVLRTTPDRFTARWRAYLRTELSG
ncbi:hypothetical protein ACWCP6_00060 [Streptomyces sp. NPDC002004]